MINPRWAVPRRIEIPFHVGVISEQFAFAIEGCVVLISETSGNNLPSFSLGIDLGNMSKRGLGTFHEMLQRGQKLIFSPHFRNTGMGIISRNFSLVTNDDVEMFAIRGRYNGVRTMLAGRITQRLKLNELVKVVVTIRIKETINATPHGAAARTNHHIEAVESVTDTLCMADLRKLSEFLGQGLRIRSRNAFSSLGPDNRIGDGLDTCGINAFAQLGNGEPVQSAMLITNDQTTFVVLTHGDPRSLVLSWHGIQ